MAPESSAPTPPPSAAPAADPPRPTAMPPVGSNVQPGADEILFHGTAAQSAYFVDYLKWTAVSLLGGGLAALLLNVSFIAENAGGWLWMLVLAGLPGLLWTYLVGITTRFKVSRKRVETESGVLTKSIDSFELWRVLDVQYTQTILDRILGHAKITLLSTDQTHPRLELHGLPNHRTLFEQIRESVQVARHTNRPMEFVHGQDVHPGVDVQEMSS